MVKSVLALALTLCLAVAIGPAPSEAATPFTWSAAQTIAPGVGHQRIVTASAAGELAVHAVEVDLASPSLHLEASTGQDLATGREATLVQTLRRSGEGHRVVASVNGSTYARVPDPAGDMPGYAANGLSVNDGELVAYSRDPSGLPWAAFGITGDGDALIGEPILTATLTMADGTVVPLARINHRREADEAVMFTPRYGTRTLTDGDGIEIALTGAVLPLRPTGHYPATVADVVIGGDAEIGPSSLVVSATGTAADALAAVSAGDGVAIDIDIDTAWANVTQAVGGRELLVQDGRVDIEPAGRRTYDGAHPRTAVGLTAAGSLLMVTIDGRQAHSRGATIPEAAQLMLDLGAVEAVNLDGGGSTSMAVRQPGTIDPAIVNQPSSLDRAVVNALHVVSTSPTGPMSGFAVAPSAQRIAAGQQLQLGAGGHDATLNGVAGQLGPVEWVVSGSGASIDADGLLSAESAGVVTVHAKAAGWMASATVTIVQAMLSAGPPAPEFVPSATAGLTSITMRLQWSLNSPRMPIQKVELHRRVGAGPWRKVKLGAAVATGKDVTLKYGRAYQFRVRATDTAGVQTQWATGQPFMLEVHDETAGMAAAGSWSLLASDKAIDGQFARSTAAGDRYVLDAPATQFAIIGQRGRRHGTAEILIDGVRDATISLRNRRLQVRRVVYVGPSAELMPAAGMNVRVGNVSTGSRHKVDIDAFILITTLD